MIYHRRVQVLCALALILMGFPTVREFAYMAIVAILVYSSENSDDNINR